MAEKSIQHTSFTCPYCGGSNIKCVDTFDSRLTRDLFEEWTCSDCKCGWTDCYTKTYIETIIEEKEKTNES